MITLKDSYFLLVLSIYAITTSWIFYVFVTVQNTPYMDEIFHVKQAKKYCEGNYTEWDEKITTPPGLYLVSVGILVPASSIMQMDLCNLVGLRAINVGFTLGNMYLIYVLQFYLRRSHQASKGYQKILSSLNLAMFPLLYFFTFLYYTDCGSLFFILMAYLFHLMKNNNTAALFGLLAILFRQTNIVWVTFIAVLQATQTILYWAGKEMSLKRENLHSFIPFMKFCKNILLYKNHLILPFATEILKTTGCYLLVMASFILFVIFNKGIVLGDKSAHQACLNFPQILYFLGFILFFGFPYLVNFNKISSFIKFCQNHYVVAFLFCVLSVLFINRFTYVHPYLLADNRHLTFYIWRRILGRDPHVVYLYIPLYLYAAWALIHSLSHKSELWKISFLLLLVISLVPQQLLEFRYFIIPYVLFRLNINVSNWYQLFGEFFLYLLINCACFYLFLYKPFSWEGSTEIQRFMW